MPKNQKITTILTIAAIFLLLLGSYYFFSKNTISNISSTISENLDLEKEPQIQKEETEVNQKIESPKKTNHAYLEIEEARYESNISKNTSVYDFMNKIRSEGKINFKDKTYVGIGKFIEEINGIQNIGSKNWIYYVNGKKAVIGVSNYKINPGDVVSWKFEENIN